VVAVDIRATDKCLNGKNSTDPTRWVFFRNAAAEATKKAGRVQEQGKQGRWVFMINKQVET
jgi:hypothetical protein